MKPLVVFCGKEFRTASRNTGAILHARFGIDSIAVAQSEVRDTLAASAAANIVLVPLMHRIDNALLQTRDALGGSKIKLIHQWGVGLEGVDIPACSALNIPVANTPSTALTARSTAELAIKHLLDLARPGLGNSAEWGGPRGDLLARYKIGVLGGHGAVGRQICEILTSGFHCRHVVKIGRGDSLPERARALDVLILAAPLTEETRGCVNAQVLSLLSPGAFVINVGRGPLVNKEDLVLALERDSAMRFATDVWFTEPPPPPSSVAGLDQTLLANKAQVFITPHVGGLTHQAAELNDARCAEGIHSLLQLGILPKYCVNAHAIRAPNLVVTAPGNSNQHEPRQFFSQVRPNKSPDHTRPSRDTITKVHAELLAKFDPAQVLTNATELLRRGTDESLHEPIPPDLVFIPQNTDQVVDCVKICNKYNFPLIPFGAGTSLEGGVAAVCGGLSLDTCAMNSILEINASDFDCLVEPGVTRLQLAEALKHTGLFFPVDPGANASLGGMVSTRASGTTAVRYGTMRDRVMGIQAVLPNGDVMDTSRVRAVKSSAGLDLTSLLVGSEGTLGVITKIRLKLAPVAESICSAVASFDNAESAINSVIALKQLGVPIARAEFLDACTMRAVHAAGFGEKQHGRAEPATDAATPTLFLEFHGTKQSVIEQAAMAKQVFGEHAGFLHFAESSDEAERAKLWRARHNAFYSVMRLRPIGTRGLPTDVCVPLSNLYECMADTWRDIDKHGLLAPIFGHVGDGNFHVIMLHNPALDGEEGLAQLQAFNDRLVSRALKLQGTCTGEHGIGYGKRGWMNVEHGEQTMQTMRAIKRALDPTGIMNPGKVY